jgi:hypothetical protein
MKSSHQGGLVLAVLDSTLLCGPLRAVDQDTFDRAIVRGVKALRDMQSPDGTRVFAKNETPMTALADLTLAECGTPPQDSAIQKAAGAVRRALPGMTSAYALAASILLLDRLGEPADVPVIQLMGIRLMFQEKANGGLGDELEPTSLRRTLPNVPSP